MALDLSAADKVLKNFYLGPIREQLNNSSILLARLDRDESTQDAYGKSFTVPVHISRNATAGSGRGEASGTTANLPTAGQQGYNVLTVPNKYLYSTIKVTGPTIKATRSKAGAFITAIESEIKGATRDMKRAMNRQLHGDGADAQAFWTGADDTSGTTVDDSRGNAFIHLISGGTYDLHDASSSMAKVGDSIVVTVGAKAATNYAVTWTGTVSGSGTGDFLVAEDTLGYQMMGLRGIISAEDPVVPAGGGTRTGLHGLAVGTYAWWKSQVFSNGTTVGTGTAAGVVGTNRALTLALMQSPLSEIAVQSDYSESDVKFLLSNVYIRDKYVALLVTEKRFVNTMKLDGGFSGVEFNGIPLVVDPQCQRNRIYYVTPETMKIFRTSDFDWMDEDGAVLVRSAGQDAYEATLFHYGDLACMARNANGLLDDITD